MSQALNEAAARLENWVHHKAIPLWLMRGIDPGTHASYERLTYSGEPDLESDIRVRVQARQAFFFAAAYERGWCAQGNIAARELLRFVQTRAAHRTAGAGYTHLLDKHFNVIDTRQDLYDHAFFLLAFAWCYRVSGDSVYLREADTLMAHLDRFFTSTTGGWIEGDYDYECRRQNPHMHLFEAFLALYDASHDEKWLNRADGIFALFEQYFFDSETGVLIEFFDEDWNPLRNAKDTRVEPGHMMEWVWLLDWYSRCRHCSVTQYTSVLYSRGLAIGLDQSGLLFDAVTPDGQILDSNKRCWGLTELIKASLVQIREGNPIAQSMAVQSVDNLFRYYLCAPTPGSYIDQRDANNAIKVDLAPASTLYHLIVAAMELIDHVKSNQ